MRILIAHEAAAGAGGVESYLASVMPALRARGHEVAFLHYNPKSDPGSTSLLTAGVRSFGVVDDDGLTNVLAGIAAWAPDVCFVHNMEPLEVDESLIERWPVVKMMHGYFGTCISGHKCRSFPGHAVCEREFGLPCLALYLPRRCGQLRPALMLRQYNWATRQRQLLGRYTAVVAASGHMAEEYRDHGVPVERLTTAPLFPTLPACSRGPRLPSEPGVLFAGRLTELKGAEVLVEAVAYAGELLGRSVRLDVAGAGPETERIRRKSAALGVETALTGWLSRDEMTAAIQGATLIAVPSLWPEPFGLVGLEAATQGVPAVAFDVGGVGEWLRDGVNGRLVPPSGGAMAFGRVLAEVLSDPAQIERLQQGALAVAGEMTIDRHLLTLETVLQAAAATREARA